MKFGLLLASHIIEEWRQYYISYDKLKEIINNLSEEVYGIDNESIDSNESSNRKCGIFRSIFLYCFDCCLSKSPDADVVEQHDENLLQKQESRSKLISDKSSQSLFNLTNKNYIRYASLDTPFTLIKVNDKKEEKQSLIQNAYSPPIASYSPTKQEARKEEKKEEKKEEQKYNINSKEIAINKWIKIIETESNKVNKFYLDIESQLLSEYEQILHKLEKLRKIVEAKHNKNEKIMKSESESESNHNNEKIKLLQPLKIPNKYKKKNIRLYQMKLNIFILYQRFIALSNFRTLNQIGFRKILKKFDKNMKCIKQRKLMYSINCMDFIESTQCTQCMNDLIVAYSALFEDGDFNKAKVKLLESIAWSKWSASSSFKIGLKIGVLVGLIGWTISALYSIPNDYNLPTNSVYSYRAIGCFLSFLWFWSADVYIWSKYRINFVFIFEFEPRTRLTFLQYFDEAATLSLIYFLNAIIFIKSTDWGMPKKYITIWPTALLIFFILRLFLPVFDYWKSRQCIIDALIQTIISPFGRVRFRDFFMGDVLTSLVKVFADLYLAICVLSMEEYFTSKNESFCLTSTTTKIIKPMCICAPYWFRFAQCLNRYFNTHDRIPHLPNAVKYGTAMSVTLLGTVHSTYGTLQKNIWSSGRIIWLIATIISTCYLIFWDTAMDWILFKKNRICEYPKWWYYAAALCDVILRYLWTFTLFPTEANPYFHSTHEFTFLNAAYFMAFVEIGELLRRAIWAIFRVENAHVSRKDEFRSYEYVPLFYEHTSLIEEQTKSNKPKSMILETVSIFLLVLIITVVIILTS